MVIGWYCSKLSDIPLFLNNILDLKTRLNMLINLFWFRIFI